MKYFHDNILKTLKGCGGDSKRLLEENDNLNYLITGSGQPQITSEIKKHIIKVPSLKEQNAIAQIFDTAHQELKLYEQKLQLLQAQKKTLMQKLLTGEVLTIK